MDTAATLLQSSAPSYHQSVSPSTNRLRNPKRSTQTRPLRSTTTFPGSELMLGITEGVFLNLPKPNSCSSSSFFLPPTRQPPLLPSPVMGLSIRSSQSLLPSGTSFSPAHKKQNKGTRCRDQTERTISQQSPHKTSNSRTKKSIKQVPVTKLDLYAAGRFGPDPGSLPTTILTKMLSERDHCKKTGGANKVENFSGSVLTISPPPSSLPLPKFSLRLPKQLISSCKVEAAAAIVAPPCGFDAGATDNLCRLLKIK